MSNPDNNLKLSDVTGLPIDRETMARQNGYVGAYGAKTWDELVRDFYGADPSLSKINEEDIRNQLQHVGQMTGTTEATLDPTLGPSLNRIV